MKRTALAATAAVLLLLTGCSAGTEQVNVTVDSATPAPTATEEAVAPLTAETPAAAADGEEATFLAEVRAKLRPDNVIPDATDAQLIAAGEKACEQLQTAATSNDISVIEDEPKNGAGRYSDSAVIVSAARATICD